MGLRNRLILSFVLVILVCLGIIAAFLTFMAGSALDRLAASRLNDMALPVFIQVRSILRNQATLEQAWPSIEEQANASNVEIYLYDSSGKVIRQTSDNDTAGGPPQTIFTRRQQGLRPLRGNYTGQDGKTYVYSVFSLTGFPRFKDTSGAEWLVLSISTSGTVNILSDLMRPLLLAGLVALILSVILAIFLARSVYEPVGRVTHAASEMATGKYAQEVPVDGPMEVRDLATSFNAMAKQVKGSQQTLRDFVADVSHELRTPLTSIKGFAQAIHDGTAQSKETVDRAAGIIEEESQRMIRLVNNLLELSRLESGQVDIKKEQVDLKEVIEQSCEIFSMRADEKGIFLTKDVETLPPVMGDIDRLEQVFANLLDNAIKHSLQGGTVTIRGRHTSSETVEIFCDRYGPRHNKGATAARV